MVQTFDIDPSAAETVRRADRIVIDGKAIDGPRLLGIPSTLYSDYSFVGVAGEIYIRLQDFTHPLSNEFFDLNIFVAGQNGGRERIVIKHWREGDLGIHYQIPADKAYNTPALYFDTHAAGDLLPGNLESIRTLGLAQIAKVYGDWGADEGASATYGTDGADHVRYKWSRSALVYGGAGDDTLDASGSSASHVLDGGAGADLLIGGVGRDAASYLFAGAAVTVNLADPSIRAGEAVGDTLVSIENLVGSSYDDNLTGDTGDNKLSGQSGNDTLDGGGSVAGDSPTAAMATIS